MAIKKSVTFTVRGTGEFPLDMLRYDQCRPASDTNAIAITAKYGDGDNLLFDETGHHRIRTVTLITDRVDLFRREIIPCRDRWKSFLWHVVE